MGQEEISSTMQLLPLLQVICEDFPDPHMARESFWVPFVKEKIGEPQRETSSSQSDAADKDKDEEGFSSRVFLIGHSSGTVCIMRLLETYKARPTFISLAGLTRQNKLFKLL